MTDEDGDAPAGAGAGGDPSGDADGTADAERPDAAYVFRVRFRLDPADARVTVEPRRFETTLRRAADPPGAEGWLFFRDNLWRGAANDEAHLRRLAEESLGVPVESVSFRELRTDEAHLSALRAAIADDLALFRADDAGEVLHKYLGSSIRVADGGE